MATPMQSTTRAGFPRKELRRITVIRRNNSYHQHQVIYLFECTYNAVPSFTRFIRGKLYRLVASAYI
jgi:hypothetical protein